MEPEEQPNQMRDNGIVELCMHCHHTHNAQQPLFGWTYLTMHIFDVRTFSDPNFLWPKKFEHSIKTRNGWQLAFIWCSIICDLFNIGFGFISLKIESIERCVLGTRIISGRNLTQNAIGYFMYTCTHRTIELYWRMEFRYGKVEQIKP